jgi:hypothetical protein
VHQPGRCGLISSNCQRAHRVVHQGALGDEKGPHEAVERPVWGGEEGERRYEQIDGEVGLDREGREVV